MNVPVRRSTLAARAFTAAVLLGLGLLLRGDILVGALTATGICLVATLASLASDVPESQIALAEGATISLVVGVLAVSPDAAAPYLAIPPLVAGMAAGSRHVWRVIGVELAVWTLTLVASSTSPDGYQTARTFLWLIAGVGFGYMGTAVHAATRGSESHEAYRDALALMAHWQRVSGRLEGRLDVADVADELLARVTDLLPLASAALFGLPDDSGTTSCLRALPGSDHSHLAAWDDLAALVAREGRHTRVGDLIGVLLQTPDGEPVATVVGRVWRDPDPRDLSRVAAQLEAPALHLATALLFDRVRGTATADERQRVAREMHDGVAQDVASLGYLLDAITPADDAQRQHLATAREEISRVVGELRHSVFEIRNETVQHGGLGEALSRFARHVGTHSDLTVHLTLDEDTSRLRPEVEQELLRIAQECMNNARKHALADNLWVSCRVAPPAAEIVVTDDGRGLQSARGDSHGIRIAGERAQRIGASLALVDLDGSDPSAPSSGTRVVVRIPA